MEVLQYKTTTFISLFGFLKKLLLCFEVHAYSVPGLENDISNPPNGDWKSMLGC